MIYMYIVKHNLVPGGMCYYTKAQLYVSVIKFGHFQVQHENLTIGYTDVSGGYRMWGRGRCEISFVSGKGGTWSSVYGNIYVYLQLRLEMGYLKIMVVLS